jgi:hypothetical protein
LATKPKEGWEQKAQLEAQKKKKKKKEQKKQACPRHRQ